MQRRSLLALAAAIPVAAALSPAAAAPPRGVPLTPEDRADLERVRDTLNAIRTMTARFSQISGEGGTAEGVLYLSRPGKMRFEYDAPVPILLVADGSFVIYYDKELDQTSYLPIGSTPAWFLLRDRITLDDVTVTRFERAPGALRVTFVVSKEPENGSVTLTFSDKPLELRQWTVTDPAGKVTTVALIDPQIGGAIKSDVFVFDPPKKKRRPGDHG